MGRRMALLVGLAMVGVLVLPSTAASTHGRQATVTDVEFLGEVIVPSGVVFGGTEIGGLSSIT